jgi:hypothetical protein
MKAIGFSFFKSLHIKASGQFLSFILWTLLIIKPDMVEAESFFDNRSKTSYLYVIANAPPFKKCSVLLFKLIIDGPSELDIFYKVIIYWWDSEPIF